MENVNTPKINKLTFTSWCLSRISLGDMSKTKTLTSIGWFMLCFICYSYKSKRKSWWVLSKLTLVRVTRKSLRSRPSSKLWLQQMFCLSIKRLFKPTNSQSQESLNRHPLHSWPPNSHKDHFQSLSSFEPIDITSLRPSMLYPCLIWESKFIDIV